MLFYVSRFHGSSIVLDPDPEESHHGKAIWEYRSPGISVELIMITVRQPFGTMHLRSGTCSHHISLLRNSSRRTFMVSLLIYFILHIFQFDVFRGFVSLNCYCILCCFYNQCCIKTVPVPLFTNVDLSFTAYVFYCLLLLINLLSFTTYVFCL